MIYPRGTERPAIVLGPQRKELAMDQQPDALREAVGVFTTANDLQEAIDELQSCGFHRAELSVLANEEAVRKKLGGSLAIPAIEDNTVAPRATYVSPEAIGDAQGGMVGGLVYAGATLAAGAIIVSGGTIVAAIVAATLVGGAGGIIGTLLASWLGHDHAHYLQTQIDHGGLLLWVRTRDTNAEERATDILKRHSARDAHVHTVPSQTKRV